MGVTDKMVRRYAANLEEGLFASALAGCNRT
jgi:hypothetical protein